MHVQEMPGGAPAEANVRAIQDGDVSRAVIALREIARRLSPARSVGSEALAKGAGRPLAIPPIHLYNNPMVLLQIEMLAARGFAELPADSHEAKGVSPTADAAARRAEQ